MSNIIPQLVFFDLETGGLNPKRHPILQLAAIAVDENLQSVETFEVKIRFDERQANRNSLRKNHYRRGIWVAKALEPEEAARRFAEFLRRHASVTMLGSDGEPYHLAQLVAHNAQFDAEFLQTWYERLYMYLPARDQVFCTLQRAMWLFHEHPAEPRPIDFKLATLCKHFGVQFHAASAHDALGDVTATVALYGAMANTHHRSARSSQRARLVAAENLKPDRLGEVYCVGTSDKSRGSCLSRLLPGEQSVDEKLAGTNGDGDIPY
jgi:DNA polymerase III epsilon subunit-like protein